MIMVRQLQFCFALCLLIQWHLAAAFLFCFAMFYDNVFLEHGKYS